EPESRIEPSDEVEEAVAVDAGGLILADADLPIVGHGGKDNASRLCPIRRGSRFPLIKLVRQRSLVSSHRVWVVIFLFLVGTTACGHTESTLARKPTVRIGSTNFSEQIILAEL